jgi:mannose-1-phosphate guanylyltransferase
MRNMPDALVLCGGAGTRLRSVTGDAPKGMASVGGRPFLELLLRQLRRNGVGRVILAVGYRAEVIREHFGDRIFGLDVVYSVESSPLGTGGALRNAVDLIQTDEVLVMNGDSYTDADLRGLVAEHRRVAAEASMVVVPTDGRGDVGSVAVDENGCLALFAEKESSSGIRYNNAGIYVLSLALLKKLAPGVQISLERDLFPQWIQQGKLMKAMVHSGGCMDIGTPERFGAAQDVLAQVEVETAVSRKESQE